MTRLMITKFTLKAYTSKFNKYLNSIKALYLLFIFLAFYQITFSQGNYFIKNYTPSNYSLQPQNFAIAQSKNGVIYIANNGGLLEYNGSEWNYIEIEGQNTFSLSVDKNDRVFVGASSNFGYVDFEENGKSKYVSLKNKFQLDSLSSFEIRKIISTDDWTHFFSDDGMIYSWNESKILTSKLKNKLVDAIATKNHTLIIVDDQSITYEWKNGKLIEKTSILKSDEEITLLYPYKNHVWILTKNGNLYRCDENFKNLESILEIPSESYTCLSIIGNKIIIGTNSNGIFILDTTNNISYLNKKNGLIDDNIQNIYIDYQQNLWVATTNGLSKVEVNSPLTQYDFSNGLTGTVEGLALLKNEMVIGTQSGLFILNEENKIEKLNEIENGIYSLLGFEALDKPFVLLSELNGIFEMDQERNLKFIESCAPWSVSELKGILKDSDSKLFIIADDAGSFLLKRDKKGNYTRIPIDKIDSPIRKIEMDSYQNIWLGTNANGLWKLNLKVDSNDAISIEEIMRFQKNSGIPSAPIYPGIIDRKIIFASSKGFYKYSETNHKFTKINELNLDFANGDYTIHRFNQDEKGRIWIVAYDNNNGRNYFIGYGSKSNQTKNIQWSNRSLVKISDEVIHAIEFAKNGITWFGGPKGLFRYENDFHFKPSKKFKLSLGKAMIYGDSAVFQSNQNTHGNFEFPFESQSYYFSFYSNNLSGNEDKILYSYLLEGFNENWTEYKEDFSISYTNLYEGDYKLHVRAKDETGLESEEYILEFRIYPPWYRTWVAYIFYVLILIFLIYVFVRAYTYRLKKTNLKLEATVEERTTEIKEKNTFLEQQKVHITEQKEEIEHKNKEIIDSINYAQRLQRAVIPTYEQFSTIAGDSFVLFLPKDIVSGDFYWISEDENYFWYVTADCTGHGVPGGFMSMLGVSLLNEIVNENKIKSPAAILDMLRERIISSLNKSITEQQNKDGMDAVLIRIEKSSNKMIFAAANNSFYVYRNEELLEMKADKMPVGYYGDHMKPFNEQEFQLESKDIVYSFTDGYADQFGGPKGKKFKYKQLEEKLIECSQLPMNEQRDKMEIVFNEWKEGFEQVDDICLIGLRMT